MYKMLIVDDDWLIADSLMTMNKWVEHNIDVVGIARNGEEALHRMKLEELDFILTDVRMPKMDGISLAKHVYKHTPSINVIIMSGYEEFSYAHSALKYNVKGYILKPIDTDELFGVVNKVQKESVMNEETRDEVNDKHTTYHDRIIFGVKSHIQSNYMHSIFLKEIAKGYYLSEQYLGQLFKSLTGERFMDYVTKTRMKKACQLLSNPTLKVYEIAELIGYNDSKYFTKLFRREYGISPSKYRNNL